MKKVFLVLIISLTLLFAGCFAPFDPPKEGSEEKAIELADQVPEIKVTQRMIDSLNKADSCTVERFIDGYTELAVTRGMELPELTAEERQQMEVGIEDTKKWVKECNPRLRKTAEKELETVYIVSYSFDMNPGPDCGSTSSQDLKVKVDLKTEKAELQGAGSMDAQSIKDLGDILNYLPYCGGVMFFSAGASGGATPV